MIRRHFLTGLAATLAAPAVIRTPGLLMPVRRVLPAPDPGLNFNPGLGYMELGPISGEIVVTNRSDSAIVILGADGSHYLLEASKMATLCRAKMSGKYVPLRVENV